jgi:hypothetical protein
VSVGQTFFLCRHGVVFGGGRSASFFARWIGNEVLDGAVVPRAVFNAKSTKWELTKSNHDPTTSQLAYSLLTSSIDEDRDV